MLGICCVDVFVMGYAAGSLSRTASSKCSMSVFVGAFFLLHNPSNFSWETPGAKSWTEHQIVMFIFVVCILILPLDFSRFVQLQCRNIHIVYLFLSFRSIMPTSDNCAFCFSVSQQSMTWFLVWSRISVVLVYNVGRTHPVPFGMGVNLEKRFLWVLASFEMIEHAWWGNFKWAPCSSTLYTCFRSF